MTFSHNNEPFRFRERPNCETCYKDYYEPYNEEPPCEHCPLTRVTLSAKNADTWEYWETLSVHGREMSMGFGTLRVEAIAQLLRLYQAYTPDVFEKVMRIEAKMFPFLIDERKKQEEKQRKQEESRAKSKQKSRR